MIRRIRIQNFRSLIDVDVQLEPLTVLIGRSGTGKSNFVNAIRYIRDYVGSPPKTVGSAVSRKASVHNFPLPSTARTTSVALSSQQLAERAQRAQQRRVNAPLMFPSAPFAIELSLGIEVGTTKQNYTYALALGDAVDRSSPVYSASLTEKLSANGRVLFSQIAGKWEVVPKITPSPKAGRICLGSLTGFRDAAVVHNLITRGVGCYDFPGSVLQVSQDLRGQVGFDDYGRSYLQVASSVLDDVTRIQDWNALVATMAVLNRSVTSIELSLPSRQKLQVAYSIGDKITPIDVAQESEGFRRYLATLLALYQAPAKQTVIFEHPENGIHPGALETLSNEFKRHVDQGRGQVILTTHSPQLLDHFKPEQIRVVDIENGQTRIGPLAPEQIEAIKERLLKPGELLTVDPARLAGQLAEVPA